MNIGIFLRRLAVFCTGVLLLAGLSLAQGYQRIYVDTIPNGFSVTAGRPKVLPGVCMDYGRDEPGIRLKPSASNPGNKLLSSGDSMVRVRRGGVVGSPKSLADALTAKEVELKRISGSGSIDRPYGVEVTVGIGVESIEFLSTKTGFVVGNSDDSSISSMTSSSLRALGELDLQDSFWIRDAFSKESLAKTWVEPARKLSDKDLADAGKLYLKSWSASKAAHEWSASASASAILAKDGFWRLVTDDGRCIYRGQSVVKLKEALSARNTAASKSVSTIVFISEKGEDNVAFTSFAISMARNGYGGTFIEGEGVINVLAFAERSPGDPDPVQLDHSVLNAANRLDNQAFSREGRSSLDGEEILRVRCFSETESILKKLNLAQATCTVRSRIAALRSKLSVEERKRVAIAISAMSPFEVLSHKASH